MSVIDGAVFGGKSDVGGDFGDGRKKGLLRRAGKEFDALKELINL